MAELLSVDDVLERLEDDDFGLSSGEESEYEGEDIHSYLPLPPEDLLSHTASVGRRSRRYTDSDGGSDDSGPSEPATGQLQGR